MYQNLSADFADIMSEGIAQICARKDCQLRRASSLNFAKNKLTHRFSFVDSNIMQEAVKQSQSLSRVKQPPFREMGIIIPSIVAGYLAAGLWTNLYQFRHGSYHKSVTPDPVRVVWETSEPSIGQIEYGSIPALGQKVKERQAVLHHEVQLSGLNSYSLYYYSVNVSAAVSFNMAAAAEQANFRFAVFGDTRDGSRNAFTMRHQTL